jgi:hypothetical protein
VTDSTIFQIVTYRDEFQPAFESLNLDWIEEYFWVEDIDRQVLSDPKCSSL